MSELFNLALQPFAFPFMQQAFIISVLIAVPTALLSSYLVLKGWALMGDAIAHGVLPGVVIAYMIGLPLAIGAFGAGMLCAIATGFISDSSRLKEDTVMGIVFSGMFAAGLVLYVSIRTDVHLDHILFGNILGVSTGDIIETGIIAAAILLVIIFKGRDLLLYIFDPQQAAASGLPTTWLYYGLLTILSLAIVSALKAVGLILAIALLVSPGAIAFLVTRRFQSMQILSVIIAVFASFFGIYLSFWLNSAPAPTIVLVLSVLFLITFALTRRQTDSVILSEHNRA